MNGDRLHMAIFRRMEAMLEHPDEHGIYPTSEFMAGLKGDVHEWARDLAYQAAGAGIGVAMRDKPGYVMPTERVAEATDGILESFGVTTDE